jgi:hypothetical protein
MSSVLAKFPIRSFNFAIAAIGLGVAALCSGSTTAQAAANAQWCLMRDGGQDCSYYTMAQCLASASGQGGQCDPNFGYYDRSYAQYRRPYYPYYR